MKITMNKKHLLLVFVLCLIGGLFCACHKEEEIKEPTDYRDKWVGEYEHFDSNGKKDGSIFISKVYDYNMWIWLKGMAINMAHYIDKDGNMPLNKSVSPPDSYGAQFTLEGYIDNNTLVLKYWKIVSHEPPTLLLDVKCVKKEE